MTSRMWRATLELKWRFILLFKHTTLASCIQIKWQRDIWLNYVDTFKSYKGLWYYNAVWSALCNQFLLPSRAPKLFFLIMWNNIFFLLLVMLSVWIASCWLSTSLVLVCFIYFSSFYVSQEKYIMQRKLSAQSNLKYKNIEGRLSRNRGRV